MMYVNWWNILFRLFGKPQAAVVERKGCRVKDTQLEMERYLGAQYEFRFNLLTEANEFRSRQGASRGFLPVTQRELNTFCIGARKEGIDCWDRDISRYIHSLQVESYHPFRLYMDELPAWDGVDRLEALARRVSDGALWCAGFRRWMLALAAAWMGLDGWHANSVVPVLVSRRQGWQKSTFCKLLLPPELQSYYTDSFDLAAQAGCERKLAAFGLINLDEFDKLPVKKMALLKNLIQMAGLTIRKAYRNHYSNLPRIASFIATSNHTELLTDPTGSRRFLCVEVEHKIDCSPIPYVQLYAQLKAGLQAGERYWFTSEEEEAIMESNRPFYKQLVEEAHFFACFRPAASDEKALLLSALDIFQRMKRKSPAAMRAASPARFGSLLGSWGVARVHTEYGNRYRVVEV